jgi:hypothetical protein
MFWTFWNGSKPNSYGIGPVVAPSISLAVTTASTPGALAAAVVSIPLIRAWAYGLRTTCM